MIYLKKICDYESMAQLDWGKELTQELISWAKDWQYSLLLVILFFII